MVRGSGECSPQHPQREWLYTAVGDVITVLDKRWGVFVSIRMRVYVVMRMRVYVVMRMRVYVDMRIFIYIYIYIYNPATPLSPQKQHQRDLLQRLERSPYQW